MLCGEEVIVNTNGKNGVAASLRCKCWGCEFCAPMNRRLLIRRGMKGQPNTFITLTVNPAFGDSPIDRARRLADAWRKYRRKYRRQYPSEKLPFLAVFEKTKLGEPHLHIIARSRWVDQKELSDFMRQELGAPVVWIERISKLAKVVWYVTKYVGKSPERFGSLKRFWSSLDYINFCNLEDAPLKVFGEAWLRFRHDLSWVARQLEADGIDYEWQSHRVVWGDGT